MAPSKTLGLLLVVFLARLNGESDGSAGDFRRDLAEKAAAAEEREQVVLRGRDDWLFLVSELRSISVGRFWGEDAAKVSRASRPDRADALPAILDFHSQLEAAGIGLIVVPVPPKAIIYPELISGTIARPDAGGPPPRLDAFHQEFYGLLKAKGIKVLDLVPHLMKLRFHESGNAYCRHDTHWSSRSCELAARLIMKEIGNPDWLKSVSRRRFVSRTVHTEIVGDLWHYLGEGASGKERLPLVVVSEEGRDGEPIESWRESPVLLLGDSHTLVFHLSGLHATGAGLADHLAKELGLPVDLVGRRADGVTSTRIDLRRRRDNLAGKKVVIWCFTARDFTESFQGWRKLPVIQGR